MRFSAQWQRHQRARSMGICTATTCSPLQLKRWDDLIPTGCIRPSSMHKDHGRERRVDFCHSALLAKSEIGRPTKSACPITPLRKRPSWNAAGATAEGRSVCGPPTGSCETEIVAHAYVVAESEWEPQVALHTGCGICGRTAEERSDFGAGPISTPPPVTNPM